MEQFDAKERYLEWVRMISQARHSLIPEMANAFMMLICGFSALVIMILAFLGTLLFPLAAAVFTVYDYLNFNRQRRVAAKAAKSAIDRIKSSKSSTYTLKE